VYRYIISVPFNAEITWGIAEHFGQTLQRVLDGSTCLDDWTCAFSQVFNLTGRAVNSQRAPNPALLDACREYDEMLRKWYQQLPSLQGWLIAERTRLESRLAHGSRLRAWLRLHGQTR
jgi:hypothetical protein